MILSLRGQADLKLGPCFISCLRHYEWYHFAWAYQPWCPSILKIGHSVEWRNHRLWHYCHAAHAGHSISSKSVIISLLHSQVIQEKGLSIVSYQKGLVDIGWIFMTLRGTWEVCLHQNLHLNFHDIVYFDPDITLIFTWLFLLDSIRTLGRNIIWVRLIL